MLAFSIILRGVVALTCSDSYGQRFIHVALAVFVLPASRCASFSHSSPDA
jgi:hypothetical protein